MALPLRPCAAAIAESSFASNCTAALAALQKDSGYMFDTEETPPPYAAGTGRTAMTTDNSDSALRKAMGLPME